MAEQSGRGRLFCLVSSTIPSSHVVDRQVWDCNCSDCGMRANRHFVIPARDLAIDHEHWIENTTLYEWGSKTAKRRFCKKCGILPFYTPRSNPDGFGITLACVDFGDQRPNIVVNSFDGQHWEEFFNQSSIAEESKER